MEWYIAVSCFSTNALRIFLCLYLIAGLLQFAKPSRAIMACTLIGSALVTTLSYFQQFSLFYMLGVETILLIIIARRLFREKTRLGLFLIIFYEIGVALWEFLCSSWMGVFFRSNLFVEHNSAEYVAAIWLVRLLMIAVAFFVRKKDGLKEKGIFRLASVIVISGVLGTVALSEQTAISISDDTLTSWLILSVILMMSVLFYNMSHQYEMEKEAARLKTEQAELLERDYKELSKSYSVNARLYHDLNNHIEALHGLLTQGKTGEATGYLEAMQGPVQEITQFKWTGDEAIDYLINSKIVHAGQERIQTQVNIEFPRNTNIRSIDLAIILGNLLDNALEGSRIAEDEYRFMNLTIRRINSMLVIKVENGYSIEPVIINNELQTTKIDNGLHGWGLKSTRAAAERYDGTIETSCDDGIFRAVATLFYNAVQT